MKYTEIEPEIEKVILQLGALPEVNVPSEPPGLPSFNRKYLLARGAMFNRSEIRTLLYLNDILKKAQHCVNTGNPSTGDLFLDQLQQAVTSFITPTIQRYVDALITPVIALYWNSRDSKFGGFEAMFDNGIKASESLFSQTRDLLLLEHIVHLELTRVRFLIRKSRVDEAITSMVKRLEFIHAERMNLTTYQDADGIVIKLLLELNSYSLLSPAFKEGMSDLTERFEFILDDFLAAKGFLPSFCLLQSSISRGDVVESLNHFNATLRLLNTRDELSLLATAFPVLMELLDNYPERREVLYTGFRSYAEAKLPKYMRRVVFAGLSNAIDETK